MPSHTMLRSTVLSCPNLVERPCHCTAGDLRGHGSGVHSASTSSLQYAHEESVNGIAALPHVRTGSVADSGDETAHTAGVLLTAV